MEFLNFNSVELLPNAKASAAFMVDSGKVFREDTDITPVVISESLSYIPWGADNQMPFDILNLIESDGHYPPVRCSMPKFAMAVDLYITPINPQQRQWSH